MDECKPLLRDLVTYNMKHNEANGESGNDGANDNHSWNCGHEVGRCGLTLSNPRWKRHDLSA